MDVKAFIERIGSQGFVRHQIAHIEQLPARQATYAELEDGLQPPIRAALDADGIERLYTHQAEAVGLVRKGQTDKVRALMSPPGSTT